jgi:hypothetical protein
MGEEEKQLPVVEPEPGVYVSVPELVQRRYGKKEEKKKEEAKPGEMTEAIRSAYKDAIAARIYNAIMGEEIGKGRMKPEEAKKLSERVAERLTDIFEAKVTAEALRPILAGEGQGKEAPATKESPKVEEDELEKAIREMTKLARLKVAGTMLGRDFASQGDSQSEAIKMLREELASIRKLLEELPASLKPSSPVEPKEDWMDRAMKYAVIMSIVGGEGKGKKESDWFKQWLAMQGHLSEKDRQWFERLLKVKEETEGAYSEELSKRDEEIEKLKDEVHKQYINMLNDKVSRLEDALRHRDKSELEKALEGIASLKNTYKQLEDLFGKKETTVEQITKLLKELGIKSDTIDRVVKILTGRAGEEAEVKAEVKPPPPTVSEIPETEVKTETQKVEESAGG